MMPLPETLRVSLTVLPACTVPLPLREAVAASARWGSRAVITSASVSSSFKREKVVFFMTLYSYQPMVSLPTTTRAALTTSVMLTLPSWLMSAASS